MPANRKVFETEVTFLRKLGFTTKEISSFHDITANRVYVICKDAEKQGVLPKSFDARKIKKTYKKAAETRVRNFNKIINVLKSRGPCTRIYLSKATGLTRPCITTYVHRYIEHASKLMTVYMGVNIGTGHMRKVRISDFVKKDFAKKRFVAIVDDRTALVRFFIKALKRPRTSVQQWAQTYLLRKYLSEAERIAVLWALGVRKWSPSQVKSGVQVDGVLFPRGYKKRFKKRVETK